MVLRYKVTASTEYSGTVFGEASIFALVPFIADPADTLKDAIFGGLCLLSEKPLLHVLGVFSWIYILVVHAVMVMRDDTLMELVAAYLGVYHAPVKSQGSEDSASKAMKVLALLYKQTTPSKRRLIALEDGPQTAMALIYAVFEQPNPFVILMNVLLPVLRYLFAVMLNRPLRRRVWPWLQGQFDQAIADKNEAKVVALGNSLVEEVDGDQALQLGIRRAFDTLAFQSAGGIAQILIQHDKLKNLKLDMQKSSMDAHGATSLGASLEKLKGLQTLQLHLDEESIGVDGARNLRASLQKLAWPTLPAWNDVLHLDRPPSLGSEGAQALGKALEQLTGLQTLHLDLGGNYPGSEGARAFGKALEQLTGLQTLHLNLMRNSLGSDVGQALGKALERLTGLHTLHLNLVENSLDSKGAQALGKALEQLTGLQTLHLDLMNTSLGLEGGQALGKTLKWLTDLQTLHLNLGVNSLGSEGAQVFWNFGLSGS